MKEPLIDPSEVETVEDVKKLNAKRGYTFYSDRKNRPLTGIYKTADGVWFVDSSWDCYNNRRVYRPSMMYWDGRIRYYYEISPRYQPEHPGWFATPNKARAWIKENVKVAR